MSGEVKLLHVFAILAGAAAIGAIGFAVAYILGAPWWLSLIAGIAVLMWLSRWLKHREPD